MYFENIHYQYRLKVMFLKYLYGNNILEYNTSSIFL